MFEDLHYTLLQKCSKNLKFLQNTTSTNFVYSQKNVLLEIGECTSSIHQHEMDCPSPVMYLQNSTTLEPITSRAERCGLHADISHREPQSIKDALNHIDSKHTDLSRLQMCYHGDNF